MHYVPGEHDWLDQGQGFRQRHGQGTKGDGWYSFDSSGVHFIALVNVVNFKAGSLTSLGRRSDRLAEGRCERALRQHAHRRLHPYPALGRLSGLGASDIGISITSGGTGKNELSANETAVRIHSA